MSPKSETTAKKNRKPPRPRWSADWEVGVRVWIERHGKTLLADGLADLLAAIEQTQSISGAARLLHISYRHAWELVQAGNDAAGEPLLEAAVGGRNGGGAQLTASGKLSLEVFDQLREQVRQTAANLLQRTLQPNPDLAATVHLAAAISLQEVVAQVLTEYALRQPGIRVRTVFGASNELADHLLAGAPCDLFVSADALHLDRLAAEKRIRDSSRTLVATNSLVAIGPDKGPEIGKPRDLLTARKIVLADPASPLGKCSRAYLEQIGIYESLSGRAVVVDNSRAVLAAIRGGHADAGLAFASDANRATGCRALFPVRAREASLSYWAAICLGQRQRDAQALLDFFATPAAQRCFRRCGLTLPTPARRRRAVR